jgi:hypothetical protein
MKRLFTLILLLSSFYHAFAQDSLRYFNHERYQITATGMTVLGSWGTANLVVGGIGWAGSTGTTKYFYQMNTFWGAANLGIAILGYSNAQKTRNAPLSAQESLAEQQKIEKIFLINGGLDLVYIGTGIYLNHRGIVNNNVQLRGYGPAVIMQGAFLPLFDATMYTTNKANGSKLRKFLEKNPLLFDGKRVGMIIKF